MDKCVDLTNRFTLTGQDRNIRELQKHELEEYQLIYNDLISMHCNFCGHVPEGMDIQVINKILTHNDENITPLGLVKVSLEHLAKILTFAKAHGIKWQIDCQECIDTHFKKLSHFHVKVDCHKDHFMTMARESGFRY
jgi:predicted aldo/keto reductase-like oxidoreductase